MRNSTSYSREVTKLPRPAHTPLSMPHEIRRLKRAIQIVARFTDWVLVWMLLFRECMDDYMDVGIRAKQDA
jgi:hypothetical protein